MKNGVSIFLKEEEKVLLNEKTKKIGISKSAYIRELILNIDYIKEREKLELLFHTNETLLYELNKIGTNINQIAYSLNSNIYKDPNNIKKEMDQLKNLLKEHKDFVKKNLNFKLLRENKANKVKE
ncbi:plasmid mobilization protein [Campylobacter sp. MIT 97-5078]|uniref:plasmid mobilization protein n=1 Tax=Campylobacter sp. MIT 97-5078 TaxID=1548153 RepID=UPI000512D797|nr:plasmid mobilization relaxosome protein MobC [Campylobacter sp. MIT 97-5078]KGI55665.1 hypothetical protein LR59_10960 [Campylobacter sp. MIT 97-5078]KGI56813.1 hypothetical protein LR59_04845 [Campylobacter sp. MIT 97-5078]TQR25590.1 plasmid mobilization relaxosome protein MobC [Campylobacter sp. MIT 97-5078]